MRDGATISFFVILHLIVCVVFSECLWCRNVSFRVFGRSLPVGAVGARTLCQPLGSPDG